MSFARRVGSDLRIQKNTGRLLAFAGAYTFKNKQSSFPIAEVKPYAAGVSEEAPVCGQIGGSIRADVVVLFRVGA
jgi:hypothetical protein